MKERRPLPARASAGAALNGRPSPLGVWGIALLTAALGLMELWSVVAPQLPERFDGLGLLLPAGWRHGSGLLTAVSAFFFLELAANLLRRKRLAWGLALALLVLSLLNQLLSGRHWGNTVVAAALVGWLLLLRSRFTARSDRPSLLQGGRVAMAALLFTLVYGTLGFFLLDRYDAVSFSLRGAMLQTLAMFFTQNEGNLQPVTGYGRFFAGSIDIVGASTLLYAVVMLFRPVIFRDEASDEERRHARSLVERYGQSSLARIALLPDKWFCFSPSGESMIAYAVRGRGAVATTVSISDSPPSPVLAMLWRPHGWRR